MQLEHSWHERKAAHSHYRRYRDLIELNRLTNTWVEEIQALGGGGAGERDSYALARGLSPAVAENLWMLGSLGERDLDQLLDDTEAADVLGRLEHTVWAAQAYTLIRLFENTPEGDRKALDSLLEQTAWKLGRRGAEARWSKLPEEARKDLRSLHLALSDSPFSGPTLVRRAVPHEISLELLACPHQVPYQEIALVRDQLCSLHAHWVRGFVYALNTRVSVENRIETPRCRQRWFPV